MEKKKDLYMISDTNSSFKHGGGSVMAASKIASLVFINNEIIMVAAELIQKNSEEVRKAKFGPPEVDHSFQYFNCCLFWGFLPLVSS